MAKNILQDIVPPEKRSIRNVPIPSRPGRSKKTPPLSQEKTSRPAVSDVINANQPPINNNDESLEMYRPKNRGSRSKKGVWIGIVGALLVIIFFVASIFSSATIKITPKQTLADTQNKEFTATKDPQQSGISFDVVRISKSEGAPVTATGEEEVERKASGKIVIFNDYDGNNQRLIRNTRFETPEGLIYRINESVVVPGRTTKGGETVPGSIEVTVYADEPGEKYNIGLKDFTIPGFKGDPRFDKMYARSKTEMTGGIVGVVKTVSESDKVGVQAEIREKLKVSLLEEIKSQIPDNFHIISDGIFYTWNELPQTEAEGGKVTVNEEGIIYAIIVNEESLAGYLASELTPELSPNSVRILNSDNLSLVIKDKESFDPNETETFTFVADGEVGLVASIDEEAIKTDLVGKPRKDLNSILTNYSAIKEAKAIVSPFWKRSFPNDPKDIRIEEVINISK